jgi:hypothetical protein
MDTDRQIWLLNEMQKLLEGQIDFARQGRLSEVEALGKKVNGILEEIAQRGTVESAEFEGRRKQIARLYRDLRLTLTDQRDEVSRELDRIRRGRKTIGVYRSSIQAVRK